MATLTQLVQAKAALIKAESTYNKLKEEFIRENGCGVFENSIARVTITEAVRKTIKYSDVVKDLIPNANLKAYTSETPYTSISIVPFTGAL